MFLFDITSGDHDITSRLMTQFMVGSQEIVILNHYKSKISSRISPF